MSEINKRAKGFALAHRIPGIHLWASEFPSPNIWAPWHQTLWRARHFGALDLQSAVLGVHSTFLAVTCPSLVFLQSLYLSGSGKQPYFGVEHCTFLAVILFSVVPLQSLFLSSSAKQLHFGVLVSLVLLVSLMSLEHWCQSPWVVLLPVNVYMVNTGQQTCQAGAYYSSSVLPCLARKG